MRPLLALVFPPALVASTYPCTETTLAFQMDVTPRWGVLFDAQKNPCSSSSNSPLAGTERTIRGVDAQV